MTEQVEFFQIELAIAFRDHRTRIEDILDQNTEALEDMDRATQLDMSRLRAENASLREHAGLKAHEPQLCQTIMFDAAEKASTPKDAKQNAKLKGATHSIIDDGGEGSNSLKRYGKVRSQRAAPSAAPGAAPGGSWQSFVCWVPNGAALEQAQPWQSLPEKTALAGPRPRSVSTTKDADLEDLNSDDELRRFEVVKAFAATARELKLSMKYFTERNSSTEDTTSQYGDMQSVASKRSLFSSRVDPADGVLAFADQAADWFILHPQDAKREIWDVSILVLVVYDMVTIPLSLFDLGDSAFLIFMGWTTRVFWTLDMAMSACTGVVMPDGTVRGDARFIVQRYLKTWFAIDLFIVASDWLELAVHASAGAGFLGRLSRAFRVVRVVRLLRLVRIKVVVESITERIQSEKIPFILSVVRFMVLLLSVAHVAACVWWGIGDQAVTDSWVEKYGGRPATIESQYLLCLHFALAQFTGGMDEVAPASALERLYVILLFVLAFVITTLVLSVLTSGLTQMHIIGGVRERQIATLRKYLRQNYVSSALAMRILRSAQHALSADLTADVVELLPVVSETLRVEMDMEMYGGVFCQHAFFADYIQDAPTVMRRVCHYAISMILLSQGDVVFSKGECPAEPKMYFVIKGTAEYEIESGTRQETLILEERSWIAEPVLWTYWTHMGDFTATSEVKMAAVDAKVFQDISHRFRDRKAFDPKIYAADFVQHLNAAESLNDMFSVRYEYATLHNVPAPASPPMTGATSGGGGAQTTPKKCVVGFAANAVVPTG